MGRPIKHTPDLLRELLDASVREPHTGPKKIARKHHVSPATFYNWQRESAQHEKAGLTESPWLVEWLGNVSWFHRHCQFCRAVAIASDRLSDHRRPRQFRDKSHCTIRRLERLFRKSIRRSHRTRSSSMTIAGISSTASTATSPTSTSVMRMAR